VVRFVITAIREITLERIVGTYMDNQLEVEVVADDKAAAVNHDVVEALNRHMWRIVLVSQLFSPTR
jgi:zona occludens toxin (predicted ATPase)